MDGGLIIKEKLITLTLIIFTFLCFFFLGTKAQALTYCVGCNSATAATCSGADPGNMAADPCDTGNFCTAGTNGVVCPTIADAIDSLNANADQMATIRIAQNPTMPLTPYTGPGSTNPIDNTATMADQTINILGGWTATTCANQTVNATNTVVQAPMTDRVFLIDNTTNFSLDVTLEGLTITGGAPLPNCGGGDNGGGGMRRINNRYRWCYIYIRYKHIRGQYGKC